MHCHGAVSPLTNENLGGLGWHAPRVGRSAPPYTFNEQSAAWIRAHNIFPDKSREKIKQTNKIMQACRKFSPMCSTNQIAQRLSSFMKCDSSASSGM